MARQRLRASRAVSPPADDFKRIHGIGPAIERRLHSAGIRTFARLAALSPGKVAAIIPGLSAERVAKQGWIRQARKLMPKRVPAQPPKEMAAISGRQHYANFTVELLLDENDEARRTRVVHVQSGEVDTWAGWEAERLIDFLARHTTLRSQVTKPVALVAAKAKPTPEVATTPEPVQLVTVVAEPVPEIVAVAGPATPPTTPAGLAGVPHLRRLEIVRTDMNTPQNILPYGQAFKVHLSLDLVNVVAPDNPPLDFTAVVYAKSVGRDSHQVVSESYGTVDFADSITLVTGDATLPRGLYRLEAAVTLTPTLAQPTPDHYLRAWLEGGLLQVY